MKKFDTENLSTWELIEKWNEYCQVNSYHEDEIYQMHGITDFVCHWYATGPNTIPADRIEELVFQVKDYNGEEYYYWHNGNAVWFNDPFGKSSPIGWSDEFGKWLDAEYGE